MVKQGFLKMGSHEQVQGLTHTMPSFLTLSFLNIHPFSVSNWSNPCFISDQSCIFKYQKEELTID
jgi:hypothetical protein